MSGPFGTFDIASSGLNFSRFWLDTISHNIANVNTVTRGDEEGFKASFVVAAEAKGTGDSVGEGVRVAAVVQNPGEAPKVFDPTNPLADENGYVTRPLVDLGDQMVDMIVANRSYQLNIQMVQTARELYEQALRIGR